MNLLAPSEIASLHNHNPILIDGRVIIAILRTRAHKVFKIIPLKKVDVGSLTNMRIINKIALIVFFVLLLLPSFSNVLNQAQAQDCSVGLTPSTWFVDLTRGESRDISVYANITFYKNPHPDISYLARERLDVPKGTAKVVVENHNQTFVSNFYDKLTLDFAIGLSGTEQLYHLKLDLPKDTSKTFESPNILTTPGLKVCDIQPKDTSTSRKDRLAYTIYFLDKGGDTLEKSTWSYEVKTSKIAYAWQCEGGETINTILKSCVWKLPDKTGTYRLNYIIKVYEYGQVDVYMSASQTMEAKIMESKITLIPEFPNITLIVLSIALTITFLASRRIPREQKRN